MISSLGPAELWATTIRPAASISTTEIPKCSAYIVWIPIRDSFKYFKI